MQSKELLSKQDKNKAIYEKTICNTVIHQNYVLIVTQVVIYPVVYQATIQVLNQVINLVPCEEGYVPTTGTSTS